MAEDRCIQVLEDDNFLTTVTIEPFVLFFDVVVWVSSVCKVGLASSAYAPVPLSTNFGSGEGLELKHSIEIESLGEFLNLGDFDVASVYSFNCSDFQYVLVPSSNISFDVAFSRTYAEGPGTFYSRILFLTVVYGRLDIARDLKVRLGTDLFEASKARSYLLGKYEDELEVNRALLTFFDLAYDIRSFVLSMPGFEILSRDC